MEKSIVYIEDDTWDKIIGYARKCYEMLKTEIGGMAVVRKNKENQWIISDPTILKQEATAAVCHLDKEELAIWYSSMAEKYKEDLIAGNLIYLWWHSHHNMGATMSHTDWETIGKTKTGFSLVVNNDGEYQLIFCSDSPLELQMECQLRKISTMVDDKSIEKNIKDMVTKEVVHVSSFKSNRSLYNPRSLKSALDDNSQYSFFDTRSEKEEIQAISKVEPEDIDMEANLDFFMWEIDLALQNLNEGKVTPQEVIDQIDKINTSLGKEIFTVPSPKDIEKVFTSTDLLESEGANYGV